MVMVKSSNLPTNIKNDNTHFTPSGKWENENEGPILPIPGPTLLIEVATALNASIKSTPKKVTTIDPVTNKKR